MENAKMYNLRFVLVAGNGTFLTVGGDIPAEIVADVIDNGGVLIWENQGQFRLIPNSILRNVKIQYKNARRLVTFFPRGTPRKNLNQISWVQGVAISPTVVRLLTASQDGHHAGQPDPAPDTTGKD